MTAPFIRLGDKMTIMPALQTVLNHAVASMMGTLW